MLPYRSGSQTFIRRGIIPGGKGGGIVDTVSVVPKSSHGNEPVRQSRFIHCASSRVILDAILFLAGDGESVPPQVWRC